MKYNPAEIEPKWQAFWEKTNVFEAKEDKKSKQKPKYYCLDMFPYPSGAGLHVGHPLGYTATDVICRKKRHEGFNVLHPIGWDAFGLPAENFAIKTGTHPRISTQDNIKNFKRQIKSLGFSYDWSREVDTTDPEYVKWTQWIFLQLYNKGLVYEKKMPMNWCPKCKVVAANEEVEQGLHERCGTKVQRRQMRQWMMKITEYADRLLNDLDLLEAWPEKIKAMQRNWIGKSEGLELNFKVEGYENNIKVYTTRPDTLFGASFMVLSPEHPLVKQITTQKQKEKVEIYIQECASKSDLDRTELNKDKTGIFTGAFAINPVNNKKIEIWIADYVLMTYGTGAVMAVPAHDERDFEFANKYNLEILPVIKSKTEKTELPYTKKEGIMTNSDFLDGKTIPEAIEAMLQWAKDNKKGEKKTNFRLRDWVFSRNRYWGEPIPLIHTENGIETVPEDQLPLNLPEVDDYKPMDGGGSPLDKAEEWVNEPKNGKRETLTMPNWAGSSWYWLRYMDANNENTFVNPEKEQYWGPVDLYVGGAEHAVLHLLYARFWHKALFDLGLVHTPEPFLELKNQGLIMANDGRKMSKSLGNVVNPDDIVAEYGADALRVYEMFMGPFEQKKIWNTKALSGVKKFLERAWRLASKEITKDTLPKEAETELHRTIKLVTQRINDFQFNTAVSQLMVLVNTLTPLKTINKETLETFTILLNPFAPHLAEEIWQTVLKKEEYLTFTTWPTHNDAKIVEDSAKYAIQVNGKLRATLEVPKYMQKDEILEQIKQMESIKKWIDGKTIKKEIFVPNKIVGFVIG